MQSADPASGLATVDDAMKFLNVSRPTVYQLLNSRSLPSLRIGRARRIRWEDLRQFVADRVAAVE